MEPGPAIDEKQDSPEELEEYQLPSDGLIIRQMKRQGKVSRRTWFALVLMLLIGPAASLSVCKNLSWKKISGLQV